jgi:DNA-binding response OmpR family regulator
MMDMAHAGLALVVPRRDGAAAEGAREARAAPSAQLQPVRTREVAKARPRLLLAEDDREMRQLLASTLRRDGYEVIEVADGFQLFEWIGRAWLGDEELSAVALVVTDIRMPGFSGLDVLAELRQAGFETPVILITAFGDHETHALGLKLGAAAVLDKPFDLSDLRRCVHEALHRA